jgi:hypothetical protein
MLGRVELEARAFEPLFGLLLSQDDSPRISAPLRNAMSMKEYKTFGKADISPG